MLSIEHAWAQNEEPCGVLYEDILMLGYIIFSSLALMAGDASRIATCALINSPVPG